jgi:ketosteroid isomerase-like protein
MPTPIEIVQSAYAAFGRGDIPGVLEMLAEDVSWQTVGDAADYPLFRQWQGRAGAAEFFATLVSLEEIAAFEPQTFDAAADKVFVTGRIESVVKASGRKVAYEWIHVWTTRGGKVVAWKEWLDGAVLARAHAAQAIPA